MEKQRYVVEYFTEDSDVMDTSFVEAISTEEAIQRVIERTGAFTNVVACNVTKSSGGPGAKFQPDASVQPSDEHVTADVVEKPVEVTKPVRMNETKAASEKSAKPVSKGAKPAKVTDASLVREQVVLAKSKGLEQQVVIDWAIEKLGMVKGKAKAYTKAIWAE